MILNQWLLPLGLLNLLEPDELYEEAKAIIPSIAIPKRHKEHPKPAERLKSELKPEPVEEPEPF